MAFMTLGLLTFAKPIAAEKVEVAKRQSGIPPALTTLQTNVNNLLPQLSKESLFVFTLVYGWWWWGNTL